MEIFKVNKENFKKAIEIAARLIEKGKVIVCPTDTVYGLVTDATNKKATEKIFKIKKRPKNKAIPIFVKDIKMAKGLAFINREQEKFLRKSWPGKITVVLKNKNKLPKILFGKEKTIGLRIPNYKLVQELLKRLNRPLTGTSANISGRPASTKIKEVLKQFKESVATPDVAIDTGDLPRAKPSRVVDLTDKNLKILRR